MVDFRDAATRGGATRSRSKRRPSGAAIPLAARIATLAAALAMGCAGDEDAGEADDARTGSPTQSVPLSMLSAGGTTLVPPAQEHPLEELGFHRGSPDAPIHVIEFSDFGCGYCRRFHTETFPSLLEEYVRTDRVRWTYVTYVSGMFANGMNAAYAAECAGEQELFWPMARLLYQRQSDWKRLDDPGDVLERIAAEAGADGDRFRSCVAEQRPKPRVRSGVLSGARLGVRGTPSFLINGVPLVGAQSLPWWRDAFTAIQAAASEERVGAEP